MSDEIKDRIEKLIGQPDLPLLHTRPLNERTDLLFQSLGNWQSWRKDLIERLAKDAEVTRGWPENGDWTGNTESKTATHTALILDVQPIKRGVSKSEVVRFITDMQKPSATWTLSEMKDLKRRIEMEGVVSDE